MIVPLILALVAAQRLWELWFARRNTRRLLQRGGVEIGAGHYPLFVVLHTSWLIAIAIFTPWSTLPNAWGLLAYIVLQFGRAWIIWSLGPYWTTRIITVPGASLVRTGPYRFMRHPNYVVASLEIAVLPLMLGQVWIAVAWSVLNAMLIWRRILVENRALNARRDQTKIKG
ncbi:hypothetical protein HTK96_08490 [Brevundimonas vesicularis]|uniref:isoprenylcysteine carboxyl methyltransferase family protein n=1 Tax=Brevundimonas vesicularis TaxID=41276 RepID=UPI0015743A64|nr:hypothetical protein [Brevundimonas vesicularis]